MPPRTRVHVIRRKYIITFIPINLQTFYEKKKKKKTKAILTNDKFPITMKLL